MTEPVADVVYRPATQDDLPAAADLFLASVADMFSRHGISQPLTPREVVLASYGHVLRTGIFEVAEVAGRIEAIASAIVRDKLWFLSTFWVRPGSQRRGLGGPLLDRVWAQGEEEGATTFFTYSSIDTTAMAAYMRRGMLPGWPILVFGGRPAALPDAPAVYESGPLTVADAAELDREIRAAGRKPDHAWWLGGGQPFRGRLVSRAGEPAGYFYVVRGAVGPACWTGSRHAEAVLSLALRDAVADGGDVKLVVPGINHAAIRFALGSGLRLTGFSHLLTTSEFGRMERYLASGPSLF